METNRLYLGDNLEILKSEIDTESIDLCYIDPPYNSNRKYYYNGVVLFNDIWKDRKSYLEHLELRIVEIHRVLKSTGSFYLHCDPTASHYIKIMLDGIFGEKNFRNEIVWCYTQGGVAKDRFGEKHDIILWYGKSKNIFINMDAIKIPIKIRSEKTSGVFHKIDENGRKYYDKKVKTSSKTYRYYEDQGRIPTDWWDDIYKLTGTLANVNNGEVTGYPTQKPIALLERIIKASCPPDGVVLDAYAGCATTCVAAQKLKRQWVGIDINREAIRIGKSRLGIQ